MIDVDAEIQKLVNLFAETEDEAPGPVVRWSLVAEVAQVDCDHVTAFSRHSNNMMPWEMRAHAWLIEKDAEGDLRST